MEEKEHAITLLEAANETGKHVRNVFLTFMLVLAYAAVIVWSTTHMQLLKVTPITLPLLNVKVSIVAFYTVMPWLVVFLHFNLLLQLFLYSRNLHALNDSFLKIDELKWSREVTVRLFPFHFSHMLIDLKGRELFIRFSLLLYVIITIVIFPVAVILFAQAKFLPFHDEFILWLYRFALIFDLLLLWFFWPYSVSPVNKVSIWWRDLRCFCPDFFCLMIKKIKVLIYVMTLRKYYLFNRWMKLNIKAQSIARGGGGLLLITVISLFLSLVILTIPGGRTERLIQGVTPEYWLTDENDLDAFGLYSHLKIVDFILDNKFFKIHRSIYLPNENIVNDSLSQKQVNTLRFGSVDEKNEILLNIKGLDLSERNLQHSNFEGSLIPNAKFSGSNMEWANFEGSFLQGATISNGSNFEFANFQYAKLKKATILNSNFDTTSFFETDLEDTIIKHSSFKGAIFSNSNLRGVNITFVDFNTANISRSNVQGGQFEMVNFMAAGLRDSDFRASSFVNVSFDLANLEGADFSGASIYRSRLHGAFIDDVKFKGASLSLLEVGDVDFCYFHNDLTYMEYIDDMPLTNGERDKMIENVHFYIESDAMKRTILERIDNRIDGVVLCNINKKDYCSEKCSGIDDNLNVNYKLISYLEHLACENEFLARGIVRRAYLDINPGLTNILLTSNCKVLINLSEADRIILTESEAW